MSAPEIIYRLQQGVRRRVDKRRIVRPSLAPCSALPRIPGLAEGLRAWAVPATLLAHWRETRAQAESGALCLLGQTWPERAEPARPDATRWHLDPVTGTTWPDRQYCFDIDYRHAPGMGDVKYVWELNRLQYLQPIAALACLEQDAKAGAFCASEIESWIDGNPPHVSVNWASGIELALRAVSIAVVTTLVADYIDSRQRQKLAMSLEAHGIWLARYPSRFSSANNHRTAEGLGLLLIGCLCPGFRRAPAWKDAGWAILCQDALAQILPDGVGAEQTITYTAMELEMLLLGRHLAQGAGLPVPEAYESRLTLGGEYLRWFTDAAGDQPRIGDDDNACVLGVHRQNEPYVRSILGCIAAMSARHDLTPPALEPHFRQAVFGFPPASEPSLPSSPTGLRHFALGGYTVGRHRCHGREILLAMDHGGVGYLSIAAHGHADALALWLHVDLCPVLVDAGTYLYHSGGDWRTYFRSTAAHNTLCLAGQSSSKMSGNFNWSRKAQVTVKDHGQNAAGWWIEAEHDGYAPAFGATHRRLLTVSPEHGFSVADQMLADAPQHVDINYLLHPSLTVTAQGEAFDICRDGVRLVRVNHDGVLAPHIGQAGTESGGWYSSGFGQKQATSRLVFSGTLSRGQISTVRFSFA